MNLWGTNTISDPKVQRIHRMIYLFGWAGGPPVVPWRDRLCSRFSHFNMRGFSSGGGGASGILNPKKPRPPGRTRSSSSELSRLSSQTLLLQLRLNFSLCSCVHGSDPSRSARFDSVRFCSPLVALKVLGRPGWELNFTAGASLEERSSGGEFGGKVSAELRLESRSVRLPPRLHKRGHKSWMSSGLWVHSAPFSARKCGIEFRFQVRAGRIDGPTDAVLARFWLGDNETLEQVVLLDACLEYFLDFRGGSVSVKPRVLQLNGMEDLSAEWSRAAVNKVSLLSSLWI